MLKGKYLRFAIPPSSYVVTFKKEKYFDHQESVVIHPGQQVILNVTLTKIPEALNRDKDFENGYNAFKKQKYSVAIDFYNKCLLKFPKAAEIYYNLGISYLKIKDFKRALVNFMKVISLKGSTSASSCDIRWMVSQSLSMARAQCRPSMRASTAAVSPQIPDVISAFATTAS